MLKTAIIGIGGYAGALVKHIAALKSEGITLAYAVVRSPEKYAKQLEELKIAHPECKVLASAGELKLQSPRPDLIVIPTGIQYHADMTIEALRDGFPVLVEKPIASLIQDVDRMQEAEWKTGLPVSVGFQDIYSPSIRRVKILVAEGKLGKPLAGRGMVCWPRPDTYYKRNDWAGKLKVGNAWVLDSVLNNATAHFLNILLNLMGPTKYGAATPEEISFETYRAYEIESFDTVCLKGQSQGGGTFHYYATHACAQAINPVIEVAFENAVVTWTYDNQGETYIRWKDGRLEHFDNGPESLIVWMLRNVKHQLAQKQPGCSGLTNGRPLTLVVNGVSEGRDQTRTFDESEIKLVPSADGTQIQKVVVGLDNYIQKAFDSGKLFSELGVPWAVPAVKVDLRGYKRFPRSEARA